MFPSTVVIVTRSPSRWMVPCYAIFVAIVNLPAFDVEGFDTVHVLELAGRLDERIGRGFCQTGEVAGSMVTVECDEWRAAIY